MRALGKFISRRLHRQEIVNGHAGDEMRGAATIFGTVRKLTPRCNRCLVGIGRNGDIGHHPIGANVVLAGGAHVFELGHAKFRGKALTPPDGAVLQ